MKKLIMLVTVISLTVNVFAQSPEKMSYQAVVRNASNGLLVSASVGMKISILQGSTSGTVVYAETQVPTTDTNGLVTLEIGTGTVVSGEFATIDWTSGPYFIKTETDPSGGTTYTITGTSQLMSVPYALHAKTATNFTETDPKIGTNTTGYSPKWDGSAFVTGAVYQDNLGKVGIGTTSPAVPLDVVGAIQTNDYLKISNTSNASKILFQILNGNTTGINMGVDNASYTNPYITFSQPGNSSIWKMNSNGSTYTIKNNYNNAFISLNSWDTNNGEVILGGNGVENFRITNQGRVGIGTTTPNVKLEVNGETIIDYKTGISKLTIGSTSGATPFLTFGGSSGGIIETATNTLSMRFGSNSTASSVDFEPAKITFRTGGFTGYERLTINSTGNVGIGTTTPSTKLDINGIITATGGNSTNWNTAYGWGNHAVAGYVTATYLASISDVADEFTATTSQTNFTLSQTPSANSKVKMYVNGIRISNTAYSHTGTSLTYVPANNGSYDLASGDRIQFDYYK